MTVLPAIESNNAVRTANRRHALTGVNTQRVPERKRSRNVFALELLLNQLAAAGGHDPYVLRRELLQSQPRLQRVLDLAASRADWGDPLPSGWGRGIAVAATSRSFVAQVAEVSVRDGRVRVQRMVCAIDCGRVADSDGIAAQMKRAVAWGLGTAGIAATPVRSLPRFDGIPDVETHIVASDQPRGGVGEAGVPPVAAAVANAVFAATGHPMRALRSWGVSQITDSGLNVRLLPELAT